MNRVPRTLACVTAAGAVSLALAVPTAAVAKDLEHQDGGQQDDHVVREHPEARDGVSSGGAEDGDAAQPGEDETARDADGEPAGPEGVESEGSERDGREDSEQAEAPESDENLGDPAEGETAPTQRPELTPRPEQTPRPEPTGAGDRADTPGRPAQSGEPEGAPQLRDDTGMTTFVDQRRATLTQLGRAEAYLSQARGRVDAAPIAPLFKQAVLAVLRERLHTVAGLIDHAEVVDTKPELAEVRRRAFEQLAPQG